MSARRPLLAVMVLSCALACAFVGGVGGSAQAATQFGSLGTGAGQLKGPGAVAVDQASGDVYVSDFYNKRLNEFEALGSFVRAWGWGVLDEAKELQTCTTTCGQGIGGSGPGQLEEGQNGVAVDNDPLSPSYQDVYVYCAEDHRVQKFGPSGEFLLSFEVQDLSDNGPIIAVGPDGRVYVGATARVEVFEPSGVLSEEISLAGLSDTGSVTELTIDGAGDVFIKDRGVSGVREFEADGSEMATRFDAGSETVTGLAVNESGDLFVGEASVLGSPGTFRMLEYSPSGEELASFDNESSLGFRGGIAFAPGPGAGELYVTGSTESTAYVSVVSAPVSGPPTIESGSVSAVGGRRGQATVNATLDAEGNPATYHVEYVSEADFQTSGYTDAVSTPDVSLGSKFAQIPVSVELSELEPGGVYHYRVVVTSAMGSETSSDQTVEAVPPALIDGPWVANVTSTSATFAAEIDPLGASTEYRLEYGPTTSYGQTLSGNVGEGEIYVPVSFHRQNLTPGTTYHYRLAVHNEVGVYASTDHTFTTQAPGGQELSLPDGRAWELVSPANKKGALIGPVQYEAPLQAAAEGSAITYPASEPVGEDVAGHAGYAQIVSRRGSGGWASQDVSPPVSLPPEGVGAEELSRVETWPAFSTDLSEGMLEPPFNAPVGLSPQATERTLYLRESADGTFVPLVTDADVTPGTKFGKSKVGFLAATPDMSHVIFESWAALTPEAVAPPSSEIGFEGHDNLYEWSENELQLVNITPGTPQSPNGKTAPGATLGSFINGAGMAARAISTDGRWVVWGYSKGFVKGEEEASLYVRDMASKETYRIGGDHPLFESMSSDGSKIFFLERGETDGGNLYVFDTGTGTEMDLTANHGTNERNAGVQNAVMGAGEEGSYVYFVATGVLASGAVSGADNVYVMHDTGSGWTTTYIATLSSQDAKSWRGVAKEAPSTESGLSATLPLVSSRVSPNGRYLAFMSERSLTGYDNVDAISGQPDEEVYLYDAASNHLACASCNPTGARPVGVFDDREYAGALYADLHTAWSANEGGGNHWLAGSVPGWEGGLNVLSSYQPRYLSDNGRLFFDSPDALVSQDTNGLEDVYEYEPEGVGSCEAAGTTFSKDSQGCVNLISSGQSANETIFLDANESGDDVFFATNSKLTAEDYDSSYDIYDAHVCTTEEPCHSEPVSILPCTSGDSCKAAPSPQPEIFGPAPSATFSGIGNVVEEAKSSSAKSRAKPKSKKATKPKKKKAKKKKQQGKRKAKKARRSRKNRSVKLSGKGGK